MNNSNNKITFNEDDYYSFQKILSYNKLINFVIGNRGAGKTFGAKRICINRFLKDKQQFIYLRRYQNEFDTIKNFFTDVAPYYSDHTFNIRGGQFYIDGDVAGYYLPLSVASKYKSTSYALVGTIIFDEFIIETGRVVYLKSEVNTFLDFYETVARTRNVQAILLSNSISQANPYFQYFNIYLRSGQKFFIRDELIAESFTNSSFIEKKKKTRFGKLIDGTAYGAYAIDNAWFHNNENFITSIHENVRLNYKIKYFDRTYSVLSSDNYVYISDKQYGGDVMTYSLTTDDHNINYMYINKSSNVIKQLIQFYSASILRFTNFSCQTFFLEISSLV